jgi:hypothetical protein
VVIRSRRTPPEPTPLIERRRRSVEILAMKQRHDEMQHL